MRKQIVEDMRSIFNSSDVQHTPEELERFVDRQGDLGTHHIVLGEAVAYRDIDDPICLDRVKAEAAVENRRLLWFAIGKDIG